MSSAESGVGNLSVQQAFVALLEKPEVTIRPTALALLVAHLQSNISFQERAIKAISDTAAGSTDWQDLEKMVSASELSEETLRRFVRDLLADGAAA